MLIQNKLEEATKLKKNNILGPRHTSFIGVNKIAKKIGIANPNVPIPE